MTYTTADIIPGKLYFKILESGDYRLLTDQAEIPEEELKAIFEKIEEEDRQFENESPQNDILELYKKLEWLVARYSAIMLSVRHLRFKKDEELIALIQGYGHTLSWDPEKVIEGKESIAEAIFQQQLDEVVRLSEDLGTQVARVKVQIESRQEKDKVKKPSHFDTVVMSYASLTGSGFIDPNLITLTQYRSLIQIGKDKMKAYEKYNSNGKRR